MKHPELEALHKEMCDAARALTKTKGADYSGTGDTLLNLKLVERIGLCSAEMGVLVRMCDKFSRLIHLVGHGQDPQVVDEAVRDTELDLINYTVLLEALRLERAGLLRPAGYDPSSAVALLRRVEGQAGGSQQTATKEDKNNAG